MGADWDGDIAVDDIVVYSGDCPPMRKYGIYKNKVIS